MKWLILISIVLLISCEMGWAMEMRVSRCSGAFISNPSTDLSAYVDGVSVNQIIVVDSPLKKLQGKVSEKGKPEPDPYPIREWQYKDAQFNPNGPLSEPFILNDGSKIWPDGVRIREVSWIEWHWGRTCEWVCGKYTSIVRWLIGE